MSDSEYPGNHTKRNYRNNSEQCGLSERKTDTTDQLNSSRCYKPQSGVFYRFAPQCEIPGHNKSTDTLSRQNNAKSHRPGLIHILGKFWSH